MKKISLVKSKLEFVVFALSCLFFSLLSLFSICSKYILLSDFDSQEFFVWEYARIIGKIPYKDIFYPYSLLEYFKFENSMFFILYLFSNLLFFIILYFTLKKIFSKTVFLLFLLLTFFLIVLFNGFEIINRFGVLISFSLLFGYLIYSQYLKSKISFTVLGLISASMVFIFVDQGLYIIFIFFIQYIFFSFLNRYKLRVIFYKLFLYLTGVILGLTLLITMLGKYVPVYDYLYFYKNISEMFYLAKTPFFSYFLTFNNLFIFLTLLISLFYLLIKFIVLRKKLNFSDFIMFSLFLVLFILEQKSIVRSISAPIFLPTFTLYYILIYKIIKNLNLKKNKNFILLPLIFTPIVLNYNNLNLKLFNKDNLRLNCYSQNLNNFIYDNSGYIKVFKKIESYENKKNKVFSYPGDPIFYILFKQDLPFYNAIYEGSSKNGQNLRIKYLKDKTNYVILNLNNKSIQDGVPNYARAPYEFKYILNNFQIKDKVENFLILEIKTNSNFFGQDKLILIPEYKNYLLNINLGFIPYSEGIYKYGNPEKKKSLIKNKLSGIKISSDDKVVVLIPSIEANPKALNYIRLKTTDNYKTSIIFNSCKKSKPCIINLANIPLFYKTRYIKNIEIDNKFRGDIMVYDAKNFENLW